MGSRAQCNNLPFVVDNSLNPSAHNAFSDLRKEFVDLRKKGQLCDAVIKVDGREFPIHRAIMSGCSPYFRGLFTDSLNHTDRREVVIPGVTAEIMEIIIDYAYTTETTITAENVEEILPAADQFHVVGLIKACCDFLFSEMVPENCIGIRKFANFYFCHNLEQSAINYIMNKFSEVVSKSTEFLQLDIDEVCVLLSSDYLNMKNEEHVFEAALRWIDYEPNSRKIHIARLLHTIRLGLLTTHYFVEKVKSHPYIKDVDQCRPIVIETLKFLYDLDMDERNDIDLSNPIAKPRIPHQVLFVIGGWSGGSPTNSVETYDTRADRWIACSSVDNNPRAYHGTAAMGHDIYVIGGFDGVEYFNSVRCFNPVTKGWSEIAPMNVKRCYVSVATVDEYIYAMGGFDGHVRQNTAERYLPSKNQWSMIPSMNHQRSDARATSLHGKVYICGGFNGQECLNSCEYFDIESNQWTMIEAMRSRRSGVGVIAYRDCVYAIGGFNGLTRLFSCEKYNPLTNQWTAVPEMFNQRSNFAIESIDDMIFAIGGFNGVTTIFNVECFDGTTEEWYDATDMNMYRSALSVCVVSNLPNIDDYIYKNRESTE